MKNRLRTALAGFTLAAATVTGTALTTTTAQADDTTTAVTVDDTTLPAVRTTEPAVTPLDTWWG
ncbi:hypothetical protein ACWD4O_38940 [Streptomyces sp. NPDC002623]